MKLTKVIKGIYIVLLNVTWFLAMLLMLGMCLLLLGHLTNGGNIWLALKAILMMWVITFFYLSQRGHILFCDDKNTDQLCNF